MRTRAFLFSIVLLVPVSVAADEPAPPIAAPDRGQPLTLELGDVLELTPSAQYRLRFMAHSGKDFVDDTSYDAFSHRARLGVHARLYTHYAMFLQFQDVRRWGEETGTLGDFSADGLDVHQAWVQVSCPLGLVLRLGRQEINLDNQRLIGAVGWADQARSFDAIKLVYRWEDRLELTSFYAKISEEDAHAFDVDSKGKKTTTRGAPQDSDLVVMHLRYTQLPYFRPSLSFIYDYTGTKKQNRITLGLFVDSAPMFGLSYAAEAYYQTGTTSRSGKEMDISALMGAARLSYKIPIPTSPVITVWFEYLSGNDQGSPDKIGAFDTLFATNHKFYGFMDYFLDIPTHTRGYGLMDIGGRVKARVIEPLVLMLDFHHFEFAADHPWNATTLGNEVDIVATYAFNDHFTVQGVFAAFVPRFGMSRAIKRGGDQSEFYGYLQADLHF